MNRPQPDTLILPNLKAEISIRKIIVACFSVFIFLILPIFIISQISTPKESSNQGQVAGISTSSINTPSYIYLFGQSFDLNSQAGILVIAGILLFSIAFILIMFLAFDSLKSKKKSRYTRK